MTDQPLPPDDDGRPVGTGPGPRRAAVSPAAAWIAGIAATMAVLFVMCAGGSALLLPLALGKQVAEFHRQAAALRGDYEAQQAAEELLHGLQDRVLVTYRARREFPSALPESPPADPWGTPVRYQRAGPDRAWLTSAGPDRTFGSGDDIGFVLEPE